MQHIDKKCNVVHAKQLFHVQWLMFLEIEHNTTEAAAIFRSHIKNSENEKSSRKCMCKLLPINTAYAVYSRQCV